MEPAKCFCVLLLLAVAGCKPEFPANPPTTAHDARGVVRQISADRRTATIQHEDIAGYMPAMTMGFAVKNTNELAAISTGDEITFKLVVGANDSWIEGIHFESHRIENVTNHTVIIHVPVAELQRGAVMPDGELLSETGKPIRFADYRGKALAFTFFYSRCPLPDYCPRMAGNFLKAREALLSNAGAPTNWQFLSVSFDPGFDNPAVLTAYGNYARGTNTDRWLFAAMPTNVLASIAPKLDLMVAPDGGGITHNLRTVVLDPLGRIFRQFDGNQWTPEQLTDAIRLAARFTQVDLPTNHISDPVIFE